VTHECPAKGKWAPEGRSEEAADAEQDPPSEIIAVRIPTVSLPLVGAGIGCLAAGVSGLAGAGLCILTGTAPACAFVLAAWAVCCGGVVGFVLGLIRAIDRWVSDDSADNETLHGHGRKGQSID
jgi:hypothetical protein